MTTFRLRLLGLPLELYVRNQRHVDDLVHELHIVASGRASGIEVDPTLASSIDEILEEFSAPRQALFRAARDALLAGQHEADVELTLPAVAVDRVRRVIDLLETAENLSRRGVLLTLPAPAEVWELRRWIERELIRQAGGEDPEPFSEPENSTPRQLIDLDNPRPDEPAPGGGSAQ